jgi:hypothetical protein
MKKFLGVLAATLILGLVITAGLFYFGTASATVPVAQGYGPDPLLPAPNPGWIPFKPHGKSRFLTAQATGKPLTRARLVVHVLKVS